MLQRLTVRLQADDRGADNEFTTHAYTLRRSFTAATLVLVTAVLSARHSSAQSPTLTLPLSLFERYLESLRVEAGIPGISAAILQNGGIIWERGFGRQDVEASIAATPSTPYLIGGLSQTIGATLLLRKCVDERFMELSDRVNAWSPGFPEPATTIRDLLTPRAPFGGYQYSPTRFAALTPVIEQCSSARYSQVLVEDVFERLAMTESAPVHAVEALAPPDAAVLGPKLAHYVGLLQRLAVPYQVHVRDRT